MPVYALADAEPWMQQLHAEICSTSWLTTEIKGPYFSTNDDGSMYVGLALHCEAMPCVPDTLHVTMTYNLPISHFACNHMAQAPAGE